MTATLLHEERARDNPLDLIEQLVTANEWTFDRRNDQEMAVQVPGHWCDYSLYFAWNDDVDAIQLTCALDMRVPSERRASVCVLLALINERMWMGHFGMWSDEGLPMFRHALPLRGSAGASAEQVEDLVETAIAESERFYPAFQYVIWAGKSPEDAIATAMIDTVGEA